MSVGKTTDAVLSKDATGLYDFTLDATGDILTEDFFNTSILMSLFCERRAIASEMPASHLRRGWIGNESTPGFEIGSKVWLFEQSRLTRATLNGIDSVIKESLRWMIEDGYALGVAVRSLLSQNNSIAVEVTITRPNSKVEKRYFDLWENTGQ